MNGKLATELLSRYNSGDCSPAEKQLVESWYEELVNTGTVEWAEGEQESIEAAVENWLLQNMQVDEQPLAEVHELPKRSRTWWVAAAIFIVLSGTGYYLYNKQQATAVVAIKEEHLNNDVAPGGNKAVLTLANGTTIVLDDASNGVLAQQGNAKVVKPDDGRLAYSLPTGREGRGEALYNTLATPRSGQYQLVLPDGSKVWLNAESSIRYPVVFMGNERRVQITGEAYFEVAPLRLRSGQKMPFIVEKGDIRVEVLGTHFNVNAYNDESAIKTTLLEGKVRVVNGEWSMVNGQSKKDETAILQPGEQAVIPAKPEKANGSGNYRIKIHKTDVDDVVAWKNGLFHFENADIRTVMRQVARWYDVEVVYEGAFMKKDPLFVEISRNTKLSDVLKVLQESGSAKFSIQGKKVMVK
jgi:transmembrane sensor